MTARVVTRKASRRKMIIASKTDIDYETIQADRRMMEIAERQLGGWMPHSGYNYASAARTDGAYVPWRAYSVAAMKDDYVKYLMWLIEAIIVGTMVGITICVFLFW